MKENINNYKISSCFIKNKSKTKPPKSPWPKSSTFKPYSPKPLMQKKWWPKNANFKPKLPTKTEKSKPSTWGSKKWPVSIKEKSKNLNNKSPKSRPTTKNGLKIKTKKLCPGMLKELNSKKRSTEQVWICKTLKTRTDPNKMTSTKSLQIKTTELLNCKGKSPKPVQKANNCNPKSKSQHKTSKRHTWTLRRWWTWKKKNGRTQDQSRRDWWKTSTPRSVQCCRPKLTT